MKYTIKFTNHPTPLRIKSESRWTAVLEARKFLKEKGIEDSIESVKESA